MSAIRAARRSSRPPREVGGVLRLRPTRLLAIGGLVLVAFLYWKPTQTYLRTKRELTGAERRGARAPREQRAKLRQRIAQAGTGGQLVREARGSGS